MYPTVFASTPGFLAGARLYILSGDVQRGEDTQDSHRSVAVVYHLVLQPLGYHHRGRRLYGAGLTLDHPLRRSFQDEDVLFMGGVDVKGDPGAGLQGYLRYRYRLRAQLFAYHYAPLEPGQGESTFKSLCNTKDMDTS